MSETIRERELAGWETPVGNIAMATISPGKAFSGNAAHFPKINYHF